MQTTKNQTNYYFVDESGDTTFYNKRGKLILGSLGVSRFLMIGFIKTDDPSSLRKNLSILREEIKHDPYLHGIPSLKKSLISFHAKDDCPEVREKVFKLIGTLDFTAEIYFARKNETTFEKRFHRKDVLTCVKSQRTQRFLRKAFCFSLRSLRLCGESVVSEGKK